MKYFECSLFSLPKVSALKKKKKRIPSSCYPFNNGFLMNQTEVIINR